MADFSSMNHLEPEIKLLLVNGQNLVEQTKAGKRAISLAGSEKDS